MNQPAISRHRIKVFAMLAAILVAVAGAGALGAHQLSVARAQAQSLVNQGQLDIQHGARAQAIVAFERAQLLSPRADSVRSALAAAQVQSVGPPVVRALNWLAPHEWSFLTIAFGWAAGLSLAISIGRRPTPRMARRGALCAGLLFVLSTAGFVQSSLTARAVAVVSDATGLLIAPYPGAGATADLKPGVVVAEDARYGDFVRVRGPDGERGWVSASALESVVGS